eukprot:364043-Prymnesium_polylepis.1
MQERLERCRRQAKPHVPADAAVPHRAWVVGERDGQRHACISLGGGPWWPAVVLAARAEACL